NYATSMMLVCTQIVIFYGLISATSPVIIISLFVLQTAVVSLIGLTLDIFLEVSTQGQNVGRVRGIYTSVINSSWIIAPMIGTMLINGGGTYRHTYIASLAMLFPLLYLIHKNFPRFKDPHYSHLSPVKLIKHIYSNKNWDKLFFANIILQTFFAWMVVYSPIYLHTVIGFSWTEIGIIVTIMLLPFSIIQYPLGRLADKKYGEKEIMAIGFTIIGLATIFMAFINTNSLWIWAGALFISRIGAAAVEIMLEVYFFKTVPVKDSAVLGMFRITRPLALFIAPIITFVGLMYTTHQNLFLIIGTITLIGLYPALTIKDTR
ncbi:MAG: MFS transporter, partial [bacterium]|nr:MFS transporter [bacterium]